MITKSIRDIVGADLAGRPVRAGISHASHCRPRTEGNQPFLMILDSGSRTYDALMHESRLSTQEQDYLLPPPDQFRFEGVGEILIFGDNAGGNAEPS